MNNNQLIQVAFITLNRRSELFVQNNNFGQSNIYAIFFLVYSVKQKSHITVDIGIHIYPFCG